LGSIKAKVSLLFYFTKQWAEGGSLFSIAGDFDVHSSISPSNYGIHSTASTISFIKGIKSTFPLLLIPKRDMTNFFDGIINTRCP